MEFFSFLIVSLIFYTLGRFSQQEKQTYQKITKEIKKKFNPPPPAGPIEYPSVEDEKYYGSEEEAVDKAREKVFREEFTK